MAGRVAAGRVRRAADAERARGDRRRLPARAARAAVGSWLAWSGIAAVVGPLVGGQLIDAASWRWIFAINAPFVVATLVAGRDRGAAAPAGRRAAAGRLAGRGAVVPRLAGPTLALIRQPESGWGAPDVVVPGLAGSLFFGAVPVARGHDAASDAPAGAVQAAQLRRGQPRDVRDVRRAGGAVLLPRPVPPAGRGLQRARGRARDAADHARDVRALQARGRARRPLRAAAVHGRRAARGRGRACC